MIRKQLAASKPFRGRLSLARRLTWMFALSAALLLTSFGGSTYWLLQREIHRNENRILDDIVSLLQTIFATNRPFTDTLNRQIPADLEAFRFNRYQIRIARDDGQSIYQTQFFPELTETQVDEVPSYQNRLGNGKEFRYGEQTFLILQTWAQLERDSPEKIQLWVALETTSYSSLLQTYRRFVVVIVALGVLLAALAAHFLAYQGLKPLRRMTSIIESLRAEQLGRRFGSEDWPRELLPLAAQFDRLLNEIEVSLTRLSQFSANLAHELRTPLTSMLLQTEVAMSQVRNSEEYREVLSSNTEELERLIQLVERLLLLARTEAARDRLQMDEVPLLDLIERLAEFHLEGLDYQIKVPPGVQLQADTLLLEIAIGNLLSNSRKYAHPPFEIGYREDKDTKVILISDQGQGIPAAQQAFLFDRFYRVDGARADRGWGLGLGLALVRSAMRAHGGEAMVHSKPEQGSRFELHFPKSIQEGNKSKPVNHPNQGE